MTTTPTSISDTVQRYGGPTETLRTAAASMRELHPPSHRRHAMWNTIADVLEAHAKNVRAPFLSQRFLNVAVFYLDSLG